MLPTLFVIALAKLDTDRFLADMMTRTGQIASVRMSVTGTSFTVSKDLEPWTATPGPRDLSYKGKVIIDFVKPQIQIEAVDENLDSMTGQIHKQQILRVMANGEMKGILDGVGLNNRYLANYELDYRLEPWLATVGRINTSRDQLSIDQPVRLPKTETFRVVDRVILRGRPCVVFEIRIDEQSISRITVDRERQSAIIRRESIVNGRLSTLTEYDYEKVDGLWVVSRWFRKAFSDGQPMMHFEFQAKDIIVNQPVERHMVGISFPPGLKVERDDGTFIVRDDGTLDTVPAIMPSPERTARMAVWFGLIMTAVGVVALLTFWMSQRRRE